MKMLLYIMTLIVSTCAFVPQIPNAFLNGKVGKNLVVQSVPRHIAYKYMKKYQILEIVVDGPSSVCSELNSARELLRSPRKDLHVSFLMAEEPYEHLFTIVYRMNDKFPKVYSIEGLIRTPNNVNNISVTQVERMLKQMCDNRKGLLQMQNIKMWAGGKYKTEKYLENQFGE